jgi:hypothetical protein
MTRRKDAKKEEAGILTQPDLEKKKMTSPQREKSEYPFEHGDLRDQLRSDHNLGMSSHHDICSHKGITPDLEAIALTQYNLKRGLKEFGNDGIVALEKEMEQLHTSKVNKPLDDSHLTKAQKRS